MGLSGLANETQAAPTGKQVTINTIDIWRVEGGELAEHWDVIDIAGIRQQLAPPSATQK